MTDPAQRAESVKIIETPTQGCHLPSRDYFGLPLLLAALHALAAFLTNYSMSQVSYYPVTKDTNNRTTNYPATQYIISNYSVTQHIITITLSPIHVYQLP